MFQAKFEAHSQALERIGELLLADLFSSFLETEAAENDGGATEGAAGTDKSGSEAKSDEGETVVTLKKAEPLIQKFMEKSRIQYYFKRNVNMAAPYYDDLEENAIDIINRSGVYIFDQVQECYSKKVRKFCGVQKFVN